MPFCFSVACDVPSGTKVVPISVLTEGVLDIEQDFDASGSIQAYTRPEARILRLDEAENEKSGEKYDFGGEK